MSSAKAGAAEAIAGDNAVAESFFATLRAELVDHERFATHQAAIHSIADYVDNVVLATEVTRVWSYVSDCTVPMRAMVPSHEASDQ